MTDCIEDLRYELEHCVKNYDQILSRMRNQINSLLEEKELNTITIRRLQCSVDRQATQITCNEKNILSLWKNMEAMDRRIPTESPSNDESHKCPCLSCCVERLYEMYDE